MLVKKTASCVDMLTWFEQNGQIVASPLPGDVAFFKYSTNNRRTNHVGIVDHIKDIVDLSYLTIEGNTSLVSNDNGGAVMSRKRSKKNLVAFGRPKYQNKDQINQIIARAIGEVGITEYPPNSNNVKYNTWFYGRAVQGSKYPWCATFVSWVFNADNTITNRPILRLNSKGNQVKFAQQLLTVKGFPTDPDGEFGPNTERSVKMFQKANGLTDDGIVGPKTWEKLTK